MLYPANIYFLYIQKDNLNKESEEGNVSTNKEMLLSKPRLDFDDYESNWFILRTKL